jgi:hypothetical protein
MPPAKCDSFGKESKGIFLRRIFTNRAQAIIAKTRKNSLFSRCFATTQMCTLCVGHVHVVSSFGRLSVINVTEFTPFVVEEQGLTVRAWIWTFMTTKAKLSERTKHKPRHLEAAACLRAKPA